MPDSPEPPVYSSDPAAVSRKRRRPGTWLVLIVVWTVGLAVWGVYIGVAIALLARVF
jgi:hypothetical protein